MPEARWGEESWCLDAGTLSCFLHPRSPGRTQRATGLATLVREAVPDISVSSPKTGTNRPKGLSGLFET